MDLRELKKEVQGLPNLEKTFHHFQDSWIKPIKSNTNSHLPFLQQLPEEAKQELNQRLARSKETLEVLKTAQLINQKLAHHIRYLIELKLTTFNGDKHKSEVITNSFLNDDFFNFKGTIAQIKNFNQQLKEFSRDYEEINGFLQQHLSLENGIYFTELPHHKHLNTFKETAKKQEQIVNQLGKHFVDLAKETRLKK